jgi:hypothetical protein
MVVGLEIAPAIAAPGGGAAAGQCREGQARQPGDADPGAAAAKAEAAAVAAKAAAAKIEKSTAYSVSSNTGVVVAAATATAPAPNPRFLRYAEALVVSGVFQGEPARALVDGRIIRSGDVIEPMLAVTFLGVDAPAKQLILGDKTGAQVRVKY